MKICKYCGGAPQLHTRAQVWTNATMYYYACSRCGYRTAYGVPGVSPYGDVTTEEQAKAEARRKWEQGITLEDQRAEIRKAARA